MLVMGTIIIFQQNVCLSLSFGIWICLSKRVQGWIFQPSFHQQCIHIYVLLMLWHIVMSFSKVLEWPQFIPDFINNTDLKQENKKLFVFCYCLSFFFYDQNLIYPIPILEKLTHYSNEDSFFSVWEGSLDLKFVFTVDHLFLLHSWWANWSHYIKQAPNLHLFLGEIKSSISKDAS